MCQVGAVADKRHSIRTFLTANSLRLCTDAPVGAQPTCSTAACSSPRPAQVTLLSRGSSMAGAARKGTGAAWETTSALRNQFITATMEAMPTRMAEAKTEFAAVRAKVAARDVTVNDLGVAAVRAVEFYACYVVGRVIGARSMTT